MIDKTQIETIKQRVSILDLVSADGFTVVRRGSKYTTNEHDSLILYPLTNTWAHFSQGDQHGKTLGGDVYQWYMYRHKCSFAEAHESLSRMLGTLPPATVSSAAAPGKAKVESESKRDEARRAVEALWTLAGEPVLTYAYGRGLHYETIKRWGLGAHDTKYWGWGLSFPYVHPDGYVSMKIRLLKEPKPDDKCRSSGSQRSLMGGHVLPKTGDLSERPIFFTEGDVNAPSIWQATSFMGVDALSFGNKTGWNTAKSHLLEVAQGRKRVFLMADEFEDIENALKGIGIKAIGVCTKPNGQKVDANDLLQRSELTGHIAALLYLHGDAEDKAFLYSALKRRAESFMGLEASAGDVLMQLADDVGFTLPNFTHYEQVVRLEDAN